jgi:hypothetical protein
MKSLIDGLPPEVARQIHPDWRKNETAYWAERDKLLPQYRDQWVAFANGGVIAASPNLVEIVDLALASGQHPFVTRVGHEQEPLFRLRRAAFPYDSAYAGQPLPVVALEFRTQPGSPGLVMDRVIPDTGADASALPWADCQHAGLAAGSAVPTLMGGVGAALLPTVLFGAWAHLDGNDYPCRILADYSGTERILGRDVLNQLDVLFRGPAREVVVNP